jgi:VWFA-related protein
MAFALSHVAAHNLARTAGAHAVSAATVYASAFDKSGKFVGDLSAADLVLKIDGKPAPIRSADRDASAAMFILLLDRSGSVTLQADRIGTIASTFVSGLRAGDRARIGFVGQSLTLVPTGFSTDRAVLSAALQQAATRDTGTSLWESLDACVGALADSPGYRAVVVVSDGRDTSSRLSRAVVTSRAQAAGVLIFGVEVAVTFNVGPGKPMSQPAPELQPIAKNTGGGYRRLASTDDPRDAAQWALADLEARYAITFDLPADRSKPHSIDVRTNRRDVSIRVSDRVVARD